MQHDLPAPPAEAEPPPSPERRALMARIRGKDTKPELLVRRLLHGLGYRYRLHRRDLPGTPDLVFPRRRKVVLVHGCFWHWHEGCKHAARLPRTRRAFWEGKLARNRERDGENALALAALGWSAEVVWECQVKDRAALTERLRAFLDAPAHGRLSRPRPGSRR